MNTLFQTQHLMRENNDIYRKVLTISYHLHLHTVDIFLKTNTLHSIMVNTVKIPI